MKFTRKSAITLLSIFFLSSQNEFVKMSQMSYPTKDVST